MRSLPKKLKWVKISPMKAEGGLATVAIVGENMKHTPGIAGKIVWYART